MKYIKIFETRLKKTDIKVINHPFYSFSNKLESCLIKLKNLDDLEKSTVKIYFDNSGDITISYRYKYLELFKIKLIKYDNDVMMIINHIEKYINTINFNKNSVMLFNSIKTHLNNYIISDFFKIKAAFKFSIAEINKFIEIIEIIIKELEMLINIKKYNL